MSECDINAQLIKQAEKSAADLIKKLKSQALTLALSESCTAGLVSSFLAGIPGASDVLWGAFVCYTREAKISMLGINGVELDAYRYVSRDTACLMAKGALEKSGANIAAAVTGLAGPGGDGSNVPVGTVWAACALQGALKGGEIKAREFRFTGSRSEIRIQAACAVLEMLLNMLDTK